MLEISNLKTKYRTKKGAVHAVDDVDLTLQENETVGLLGESGCGKTTLAKSIIRLLPREGEIDGGSIEYDGRNITEMPMKEVRNDLRWQDISVIPQNAMNGFDPVYSIADQIVEVIREHEDNTSKDEARRRGEELFDMLGLKPGRIDDYPHQLSGGMAQRAMIALSLAVSPSILLADEPTTGLDMIVQRRILNLLKRLKSEMNLSMIIITHDISAALEVCDRIAVMYGGRIVEIADTETILEDPRHPYTIGLRNAFPSISNDDQDLISIPGNPFDPLEPDPGCRFANRCPFVEESCLVETPEPNWYNDTHGVECVRSDEKELLQNEGMEAETWRQVLREMEDGEEVSRT